eukprot:Blabericola_migrator_1__5388@NODE_275_length_10491_cov_112_748561_g228_i0_p6_GENE_NODE_275_length_10491_cov_112_748561_g228_i0NODE_275_length_10491_cov_112_748561_g228_i0_p6_ORF_typecomplete_len136_score23_54RNA_pol_Rpb4/PF03874_16/1_3e20Hemolysin_N/PF12563_8/0_022_NODE_275_length_10491_cov_112_748561_g228_i050875494
MGDTGFEQSDDVAAIKINKELQNCRCLNLCEVQLILSDQMKLNNVRNTVSQGLIKKSHDYAVRFAQITNRQAIFDLRSALESHQFLEEFEMASLVNLIPRSAEEAKAIIPSLNRLSDEKVNAVLGDIEKFKLFSL